MYRIIACWLIASLCFFSINTLASDESHVSIQVLSPAPITREVIYWNTFYEMECSHLHCQWRLLWLSFLNILSKELLYKNCWVTASAGFWQGYFTVLHFGFWANGFISGRKLKLPNEKCCYCLLPHFLPRRRHLKRIFHTSGFFKSWEDYKKWNECTHQ